MAGTSSQAGGSGGGGGRAHNDERVDDDLSSTTATATEETPLLQSDADSSRTLRDQSPSPLPVATTTSAPHVPGRDAEIGTGDDEGDGADGRGRHTPAIGTGRAFAILMSMWALIFLQASNMSGMTMTQSTIAVELSAYDEALWFTSSYLITTASLAPLVGKLSTTFAPATLTLASSLFFAVGAVVSSQARSFAVFILGRVLVGVGGAGVMTLSLILVIQFVGRRRRGLFIGLVNAGFTIGLSTGAVVFGALVPVIGWRALFYLQAPVAIIGGLGVWLSLPRVEDDEFSKNNNLTVWQKLAAIDYAGAVAMIATIVLFLFGLSSTTIQPIPIVLSACSLFLFVVIEYRIASDPIIPLSVLQSRGILLSCLAQLGFMASRWTVLFYAPIFILAVRGLPPAVAGSILIPTNIGFGSGGLLVGWLHVRRSGSFWLPAAFSLACFAAALFCVGLVSNAATPAWLYVLAIFANGLATGAAINYTLAHLLHLASPETHFIATSLLATFRGFAGSFGTAIGGGVFSRALKAQLAEGFARLDGGSASPGRGELISKLIGSPALVFGGGLSEAERGVAVRGYEVSLRMLYQLAAAVAVLVVVAQLATGRNAPASPSEEEHIREAFSEADGNMEA